jgi:TonB family protein
MQMFLNRLGSGSARGTAGCVLAGLLHAVPADAQTSLGATPPAAATPTAELSPADRAKRDADKVFHWIMIQADKPRKAAVAKDDGSTAASAARAKSAARPPARSDDAGAKTTAAGQGPAQGRSPAKAAATTEPGVSTLQADIPATAPSADEAAVVASADRASVAPQEEAPDETLTPISRAEPQFPPSVLRSVRKGQVQVRFTVLQNGNVDEPTVVASSNPRLNAAALAAVAQWRFVPLRKSQLGVVDLGFDLD